MHNRQALLAAYRAADELARRKERALLSGDFVSFVEAAWPIVEPETKFVDGKHIHVIGEYLMAQARGEIVDLCINIPPGCMKSLLCSVMYPAWVWTFWPGSRWLCMSYAEDVIVRDTRGFGDIVASPWYRRLWGDKCHIRANTSFLVDNDRKGVRRAATILGQGTGQGGNFLIIDDPLKSDDAMSDLKRGRTNDAFKRMISTRQRPPGSGARLLIMQRLHYYDPSALVQEWGWETICLPMKFEKLHPVKFPKDWRSHDGELLWPELFHEKEVAKRERELGSEAVIAGQFQQRPTVDGGSVIKDYWWQPWAFGEFDDEKDTWKPKLPPIDMVIQSWDTALSSKPEAAESACTTWGVFYPPHPNPKEAAFADDQEPCLILLHAFSGRLEFPDLVDKAQELAKRFKPERLLIEEKASGFSLIHELKRSLRRQADIIVPIPVKQDKMTRAHAVSGLFRDERIYAIYDDEIDEWTPEAKAVIRQCSEFPRGNLKDLVDSTTQAINWVRKNNIVKSDSRDDNSDDEDADVKPREAIYG